MPLSHAIDGSQMLIALGCGGISGFFHWVSVQTSDREVPVRKLRGEVLASGASGMLAAWLMNAQLWFNIDTLGAFCVAAVVGFAYGPTGLIVAAKKASRQWDFDPPAASPPPAANPTVVLPPAPSPVSEEAPLPPIPAEGDT